MKKYLLALLLVAGATHSQEIVKYDFVDMDGNKGTVEAVFRSPKSESNKKAVIILHHGGGWEEGTTNQYSEYLSNRGFATLEPRLFIGRPKRSTEYIGEVFGSLKYLSENENIDKSQISVMGLSLGAMLTIYSATEWANKKFTNGSIKFKSHLAFYPVCWAHTSIIKRSVPSKFKLPKIPDDMEDKWMGSPLRIFAGTKDDYDDRDPNACSEFIDSIPDEKQKNMTSIVQYENATHGWDQKSKNFYEPVACKGKGCRNNNVYNKEITEKGIEDAFKFLSQ